jgi:hypothetical protein
MSFIGQDPTRDGGVVVAPSRTSFTGAAQIVDGVRLLEDISPGSGALVSLATFEPDFDPTSNRLFCDIDLDTGAAYLPLLRLALVRYQPHAKIGCEVSKVVLVDLVQTLPERTLTVTHAAADVATRTITVVGPSYTATAGLGARRSDPAALAVVRCRVQRRQSGAGDDPLVWVDVPEAEVVLSPSFTNTEATWTGSLSVPETPPDTDQRLLVVEEDRLAVDEQTPSDGGFLPRVIFAATVAL